MVQASGGLALDFAPRVIAPDACGPSGGPQGPTGDSSEPSLGSLGSGSLASFQLLERPAGRVNLSLLSALGWADEALGAVASPPPVARALKFRSPRSAEEVEPVVSSQSHGHSQLSLSSLLFPASPLHDAHESCSFEDADNMLDEISGFSDWFTPEFDLTDVKLTLAAQFAS